MLAPEIWNTISAGSAAGAWSDGPGGTPEAKTARTSSSKLQDVLRMLIDSARGFNDAASKLREPVLAAACRAYSIERDRMADELRPFVIVSAAATDETGEAGARLAKAWSAVRTALGGADQAIVENIESAEDHTVQVYREALACDDVPPAARAKLLEQFPLTKSAHDQFAQWKRRLVAP